MYQFDVLKETYGFNGTVLNIMLHVISMLNTCLKINWAVEHFMTS